MRQKERSHILVHITGEGAQIDIGHTLGQCNLGISEFLGEEAKAGAQKRGIAEVMELLNSYFREQTDDHGMINVEELAESASNIKRGNIMEGDPDLIEQQRGC